MTAYSILTSQVPPMAAADWWASSVFDTMSEKIIIHSGSTAVSTLAKLAALTRWTKPKPTTDILCGMARGYVLAVDQASPLTRLLLSDSTHYPQSPYKDRVRSRSYFGSFLFSYTSLTTSFPLSTHHLLRFTSTTAQQPSCLAPYCPRGRHGLSAV